MSEQKTGTFSFEVDSAILFQLGERLVARQSIALSELIKNSYDTDATSVIVRFERVSTPGDRITVRDIGTGIVLLFGYAYGSPFVGSKWILPSVKYG
jgi:hypothetical protein